MSYHLEPVYVTTTRTRKQKKSSKNKRLAAAKAEHEKWMKSMGVGKHELPTDKKGNRVGINNIPDYREHQSHAQLSNSVGNGYAREKNTYTGDEIMGVVLNHKSNYEPVRRDNRNAAIEAAKMRRG